MTTTTSQPTCSGRMLNRDLFLELVENAFFMGKNRFARQAILAWLANYAGDLPVNLLYAQTLLKSGQPDQALPVLERLCRIDPEYLEAAQARLDATLRLRAESERRPALESTPWPNKDKRLVSEALGCLLALGGKSEPEQLPGKPVAKSPSVPAWTQQIKFVRQALKNRNGSHVKSVASLDKAEQTLHHALAVELPTPLAAITHLQLLRLKGMPGQSLRSLASHYHQRWPDCLYFHLVLAEAMLESGDADLGVSWLHQAAARDVTGQVAERMWGQQHPYQAIWPQKLEIWLEVPVPAEIAAAMGWNQLPAGVIQSKGYPPPASKQPAVPLKPETASAFTWKSFNSAPAIQPGKPSRSIKTMTALPETLLDVQAELERVAARLNQPSLARADGRFPVYVILTTRRGLEEKYGQQVAASLSAAISGLAEAVGSRHEWRALVFYADEGWQSVVSPARYNDPWALKLALTDLDTALRSSGEMIGSVMIVGGPEVVPFHHLPNPVDDGDHDVPSDNPYGTRDENYFIPEWPVGRLPGSAAPDAAPLLRALAELARRHKAANQAGESPSFLVRLWQRFLSWLGRSAQSESLARSRKPSFGFTAAAWRQASLMVFRPIGEPRSLHASPPIDVSNGGSSPLPSARLGYFNLHGLVDAVEWYGQGEAPSPENGFAETPLEYPVALRPQDVVNGGRAPEVVFTEACYGAHIIDRSIEEALALKFLQVGSQAVIGSTCASYGSIGSPLTAADFLGHSFWDHLRQGLPAGEALRRAKIALAREMHNRQGYLDGEDQKTLISFVLYGDPLSQPLGQNRQIKTILRPVRPPKHVRTVCDRARQDDESLPLSPEVEAQVKQVVEQYLPGMAGARITVSHEHADCSLEEHTCPTAQLRGLLGAAPEHFHQPNRRMVVLSKQIKNTTHMHFHYARLTLDEGNRLVKLVVSR
ncbi:MAG TPA: C25 family cysteine peptidase [Anaerolineales bacterium]|nr:C25 family cysteine peptidase [Anaerolineales bacterium]